MNNAIVAENLEKEPTPEPGIESGHGIGSIAPHADETEFLDHSTDVGDVPFRYEDDTFKTGSDRIPCLDTAVAIFANIAEHNPKFLGPMKERSVENLYELVINGYRKATKKEMLETCPNDVEFTENSERRPIIEILKEGVEEFTKANPYSQIKWLDSRKLVDNHAFVRIFQQRITEQDEEDFYVAFGGHAGQTLANLIVHNLRFDRDTEYLKEILVRKFPPNIASIINNACWNDRIKLDEADPELELETEAEYASILQEFKERYSEQKPVSSSKILSICLEGANGDMEGALLKWALTLKFASGRLVLFDEEEAIADWMKEWIKDEYSDFVPYHLLSFPEYIDDKGEKIYNYSLPNQVGKPYHAAHICALLAYFPPEVIQLMVGAEYYAHMSEHGKSKLLSDLRVLKDIYKIQRFLSGEGNS